MMKQRSQPKSAEVAVWLAGAMLTFCLVGFIVMVGWLLIRGSLVFWPADIAQFTYYDPDFEESVKVQGILWEQEWQTIDNLDTGVSEPKQIWTVRIANRDVNGSDFASYQVDNIQGDLATPEQLVVVERAEWGIAIGTLTSHTLPELQALHREAAEFVATLETAEGDEIEISSDKWVRAWQPNSMGAGRKLIEWVVNFYNFLSQEPREANTEGGIFPAIIGTVALVFLMTILVAPLGIITAIYLTEYAGQSIIVSLVRISISNLAGVPSVVFGVFRIRLLCLWVRR